MPVHDRLPRAQLKEKIEVLDYIRHTQTTSNAAVVNHFRSLKRFAISQTTLSGWRQMEDELRKAHRESPNLEGYRRMPVLKYPNVMQDVEKFVDEKASQGVDLTDQLIQHAYSYFMGVHGHPSGRLSGGMLQAFKKRNAIKNGKKMLRIDPTEGNAAEDLSMDTPAPLMITSPDEAVLQETEASAVVETNGMDFGRSIEDMFTNSIGFNTRLIHSDDNFSSFFKRSLDGFPPFDQIGSLENPRSSVLSTTNLSSQQLPYEDSALQRAQRPSSSASTPSNVLVTTDASPQVTGAAEIPRLYKLENFTYTRSTHPNAEKAEKILENITNGHVTIYNSGTSAIMGVLTYLNPKKIAINNSGYQGTHQVIALLSKLTGLQKIGLDDHDQLEKGDVMLIETPMNPEGYCIDISRYTAVVHAKGALLIVDSTLAPPPLQDPFKHNADFILHSATKYFSGHSDLLAGFIVSKSQKIKKDLISERLSLGTNIANFDAFLLLRSLRTFKMRIQQQCLNTEKVIKFLTENSHRYPVILKLHHSSLQLNDFVSEQLNGFYNPVFAVEFKSQSVAEELLTKFKFLSNNSNSEGGETIVEMTNKNPDFMSAVDTSEGVEVQVGNLLRFSVGCEDYEDLLRDLNQALRAVSLSH
ncbi:unnamed protein product [Kuraishia capsulata CBS 1993]|uniref:HTH CENPB-type domain-containing protein n=1 Tax=Kuraishia capsulata CBS 1993 TaxID=1382522 RepID=W6MRR7_9ASCO|nr:uncharacterized protein KUCA_T00005454001 [Kuraishia capsulata CBS 1993]CDK29466.1 unnamed protein product [Kuraishia capsulata CBS 1993]